MAGELPRCLMIDADVIIHVHAAGLWELIKGAYELYVPSIVLHDEVKFYVDELGQQHPIDLEGQAESGLITEVAATAEEMKLLEDRFTGDLVLGLHSGEREALALLLSGEYAQGRLCTGDRLAIEAVAALGFSSRAVSLEETLQETGHSLDRRLLTNTYLQRDNFKSAIKAGQQRRMTGEGLRVTAFDQL